MNLTKKNSEIKKTNSCGRKPIPKKKYPPVDKRNAPQLKKIYAAERKKGLFAAKKKKQGRVGGSETFARGEPSRSSDRRL